MPEPSGVVGVLAPPESPLLGLVSVIAPVIATGNTCVVLASESAPLPAITLAEVLANGGVDQPTRFTTASGESPNLRRILVDLHDEYARHVGHADLLRESVDGMTGE